MQQYKILKLVRHMPLTHHVPISMEASPAACHQTHAGEDGTLIDLHGQIHDRLLSCITHHVKPANLTKVELQVQHPHTNPIRATISSFWLTIAKLQQGG